MKPILCGDGVGFLSTNAAAEIAVFFHRVQVVAVITDAVHPGHGFAFGRFNADDETVGNGENLGFYSISGKNAVDAFFDAKGFCTAHGKLVTQIRYQIQ